MARFAGLPSRRLLLGVVFVGVFAACASVDRQSASPANTVAATSAAATPAATSTTRSTPLPSPEAILSASFESMQRVSSVKVKAVARGSWRSFSSFSKQATVAERDSTSDAHFQSTPEHSADASRTEGLSLLAGVRSRSVLVRIGRLSYIRTERLDATPGIVPSVIPPGLWTPNLNETPFVFPDPTFGRLGHFWIQASEEVPGSDYRVERGAGTTLKLTASGALRDFGQASLQGSYVESLELGPADRWSVWQRTRTYADGATYSERLEFADYNVVNKIERPLTNSASRFVPDAAKTSIETGDLIVRICARTAPTPYDPSACERSPALVGLPLELRRSGAGSELVAEGTTDAQGMARFASVPIYLSLQLVIRGCGATGRTNVAVSAGSVNAGGTTYLDFAVC